MSVSHIRYRRLGYLALNVSDLERSRAFYTDVVGLTDDGAGSADRVYLRCSDKHHDLLLVRGDVPGVKRAAWQMESRDALEAARAHFTEIGLALRPVDAAECRDLGIEEAFRIGEPTTGVVFEFYATMAELAPFVPTHTDIQRLGHIVLSSTDRPATEAFLREHMNFRVSDRVENIVSFMRCFPNPLHHSLGVGGGTRIGLNHINFMVSNIDDIGRAYHRVKANGVKIVYGPGRHPPSDSIFLYFLDPDGMTVEYSFGMEEFPEVGAREARLLPAKLESLDSWAAVPDPEFGKHGELERLPAESAA
ncbi:bleomycin resistance protein [Sphingomonas histidinilytica]|uniref:VOC family protein n=1 Tax=Rhizorhabdus histidinilytica TaxID=439228 RepID=UPI001ADB284A|nr:VOC family protein [Rhizorhabdus histidinilytica]MBO9379847.1 bleomycin resistance protein [Rhizorhabdus histidinilytica]